MIVPRAPGFVMGLGLGGSWTASSSSRSSSALLAGWGAFNIVEGLIDHQLLGIHHVRDDLGAPLGWDLAFIALGLVLVLGGLVMARSPASRRAG